MSTEYLLGAQYNFGLYTRAFTDEKEQVHYFVYDIGLVKQGNTKYKIIRHDAAIATT
ncbi:MAG: hypothetical protein IH946_06650 [Bacteroidetes bacterium]|nr:hypothetical protein [Bacteroidota bacterium]